MAWVRLDDGFPRHRKVRELRRDVVAKWLHVVAICHCGEHLTDGRVDELAFEQITYDAGVPMSAAKRAVPKLIAAGLWIEHDQDGWLICDYLDYNPPAAEVKEIREKRRAAGRLGGLRSGEARAQASGEAFASRLVEPRPVPSPEDLVLYPLPVENLVDESLRSVQ